MKRSTFLFSPCSGGCQTWAVWTTSTFAFTNVIISVFKWWCSVRWLVFWLGRFSTYPKSTRTTIIIFNHFLLILYCLCPLYAYYYYHAFFFILVLLHFVSLFPFFMFSNTLLLLFLMALINAVHISSFIDYDLFLDCGFYLRWINWYREKGMFFLLRVTCAAQNTWVIFLNLIIKKDGSRLYHFWWRVVQTKLQC